MGWMPVKADVLKVWGSTCVCRVRFADWLTELLQKFSNFPSRKNLDSPCLRRGLGICIVDKTLVKSHGQEVSKPLPIPQALTFPSTLRPPSYSHSGHTQSSQSLSHSQNNLPGGAQSISVHVAAGGGLPGQPGLWDNLIFKSWQRPASNCCKLS